MASGSQLESEWTPNLPFVPYTFLWHARGMDDDLRPVPRREILFNVEFALSKAARLWPRKRVYGEDNPYRLVAQRVIEHLERCGIRMFRKPPTIGHSIPPGPRPSGEDETTPKG